MKDQRELRVSRKTSSLSRHCSEEDWNANSVEVLRLLKGDARPESTGGSCSNALKRADACRSNRSRRQTIDAAPGNRGLLRCRLQSQKASAEDRRERWAWIEDSRRQFRRSRTDA